MAEDYEIVANYGHRVTGVANVEIVNKYGAFDGEEHGPASKIYGGESAFYGGILTVTVDVELSVVSRHFRLREGARSGT